MNMIGCVLFFLAISSTAAQFDRPSPLVLAPSQYWDGNDGFWSSFAVRVGRPAQYVRLLVSTVASATYVVLPQGCRNGGLVDCEDSRGGLFSINRSTTWSERGFFELPLKKNLNYAGNGQFGFDQLAFGFDDNTPPSLETQPIAGFITEQHHLGLFGLSPHPLNFSNYGDPQASTLATLKTRGIIPSHSWGYTAGARYRLKMVSGSLTLGGYDASRFVPNNLSFSFADDVGRELVVGLQSIVTTDVSGQSSTLLDSGILIFIDSTVPHLWLPLEACREFEKVFGLIWDESSSLYLVNESLHDALLQRNPNITFRLGDSVADGETIDIVLPYASFDLNVSYPLVQNSSRYFPLKRALDDTQYTLGRTFLQEAYLIADYERGRFSVSQCNFQPNSDPSIAAIEPLQQLNATTNLTPDASPLDRRVIGGIVAGSVLGVTIIGVVGFLFFTNRRPFKQHVPPKSPSSCTDDCPEAHNFAEVLHELDPALEKERLELAATEKTRCELEEAVWRKEGSSWRDRPAGVVPCLSSPQELPAG